ncbi:MAG TPA: glycosyltransferase family 25 protein [Caulobacteraceae bacterium]|jgi:GR25 family glycosyltransferase involved in LPS biosynthesis|nr:glycosyltransferase family 25 protein [Caulobacteraceae bacterium]
MSLRGVYINLDRDAERRTNVECEVAKLGGSVAFERFPAVDGRMTEVRPDVSNRAEIGCYLSHLEVIRRHAGRGDWLHLVEDDVVVSPHTGPAIAALTADSIMGVFDIIFTNVRFWTGFSHIAAMRDIFDRSVATDAEGQVTGVNNVTVVPLGTVDFFLATSYLVNPRAADRTAQLLERQLEATPFRTLDFVFSDLSRAGELSIGCCLPFLTMMRLGVASTIQEGVFHWEPPLEIMDMALYVGRDVPELRRRLNDLRLSEAPSITSELIAEAYGAVIRSRA